MKQIPRGIWVLLAANVVIALGFGLIALATGVADDIEGGLPGAITKAIKDFAPTAALLFFAIIYFGLMIDVGLFDPLIRFILRVTGNNPVKVVIGTGCWPAWSRWTATVRRRSSSPCPPCCRSTADWA